MSCSVPVLIKCDKTAYTLHKTLLPFCSNFATNSLFIRATGVEMKSAKANHLEAGVDWRLCLLLLLM